MAGLEALFLHQRHAPATPHNPHQASRGQGFSPDAQREGIRRFALENDLELVGQYCDFHSGWRKSEARPEFQRLMADAAAGRFDVVLVFHTSRFATSAPPAATTATANRR